MPLLVYPQGTEEIEQVFIIRLALNLPRPGLLHLRVDEPNALPVMAVLVHHAKVEVPVALDDSRFQLHRGHVGQDLVQGQPFVASTL